MSGGIAYVLDEDHDLYLRLNKELVSMGPVTEEGDIEALRGLIQAHAEATGSPKAGRILANFGAWLPKFKKILPHDYDRMLRTIAWYEAQGMGRVQAETEAFYVNARGKGWESPLDFWNMPGRAITASHRWSGWRTGTNSIPGWAGRSGNGRGPGAWPAACPSVSQGRC